jgi:hypothetical protein
MRYWRVLPSMLKVWTLDQLVLLPASQLLQSKIKFKIIHSCNTCEYSHKFWNYSYLNLNWQNWRTNSHCLQFSMLILHTNIVNTLMGKWFTDLMTKQISSGLCGTWNDDAIVAGRFGGGSSTISATKSSLKKTNWEFSLVKTLLVFSLK